MDLGIKGRTALVCGASKGLGRACAFSLAREGASVTLVARGAEALEKAAHEIRSQTGAKVQAVAADITTPEGRARALAAAGDVDILVTNAAGPPPGNFRDWSREQWIAALDANMLTPIELIKATIDGMMARRFGDPAEFGEACAYLCSAQAGYVTGQNFLIDGGAYPGTL